MQETGKSINTGSMFTLALLESPETGKVVIKYPTAAIPPPKVLARLDQEYTIGSSLHLADVRKIIGRTVWKDRPAIKLQYIPGTTFKSYFKTREHRPIDTILRLALSAARALESLHGAGIVHRDIAASNLLVTDDGNRAVIIDLELATKGDPDDNFVFTAEGQLPYLSPEQTGRIDLPVDERSDLYAFGVVLYEILTGELPFQAEDAAGWIHAHLARIPDPLLLHQPALPRVVSDLVMRLLSKVPDNRYQTARGLRHDLEQCLTKLHESGEIPLFPLGRGDHSGRLHFPPSLYGREDELRQLHAALERAIHGEPGLLFVSGFAGAGKTTLVNEMRFPTVAAGGRFISGKFDQTLRTTPYGAFADAFAQLCHQILSGTPAELEAFRSRVLENLGANAGLLLELVPELEAIIGPQPLPLPLETMESANRFAITLLGFFHCMIETEQSLVLFLDDMQWADPGSLAFLRTIVTRSVRSHFLIVCAYRTEEVTPNHQLPNLIAALRQEWKQIEHISLEGLTLGQSETLVADALDVSVEEASALAALLHGKTDGNPFFMRQVLDTLAKEGALRFDPEAGAWRWETMRVEAQDISDNVIELMLHKIAQLPSSAREILQTAACIGNTFSLDLIAIGSLRETLDPRRQLELAVNDGLVAMLEGYARFTHDRIQQAVYQSLSPVEAQRIHLRLGRYLLERQHGQDQLLAAAQQLNLGSPLIESAEERLRLAALNLQAGHAAKAAMAYASARYFYAQGERVLDKADAAAETLSFELAVHQEETNFHIGEVDSSIQRLLELLHDAPDTPTRTRIYQLLIDMYTVELKLPEALATGDEALTELGVVIPSDRSIEVLMARVSEIEKLLAERDLEHLAEWPSMTDEHELAIMGLLTHLAPAAYITAAEVFPYLSIEFVRRALQGGLSRFASFGFGVYGMLLATALHRYQSAHTVGGLATRIAEHPDNSAMRARVNFFHAVFILHWREPLEATLPYLENGWNAGVASGDLQFASYCVNHIHGNGLFAGQSLAELEQSFARFADINRILRQEDGQQFYSMLVHTVEALRRPREALPDLAADHGGAAMIDIWRKQGNATILSFYHLLRALLTVVLEKPVEALETTEQGLPFLGGITGMTLLPHYYFLHALALSSAARERQIACAATLGRIGAYRDQMAEWANQSPANYRPKLLLIEAEIAELSDDEHGILLNAYDNAIEAAAHAGRTLDQALANERAAGCWSRRGKPRLAGLYLQQALQGYESWGAEAKVAQLMRDHAPLLTPLHSRENESSGLNTTTSSSSNGLHAVDIYSVLKAAQTVAGELVMDRMLARLIGLVIEAAGAQSGYLLLEQDGEWCIVAEQHPDHAAVDVLQWRSLDDYPEIAESVVHYVARTMKTVNLDDASKSTLFATDNSIATRRCKSLLCLPIVNRGELGGILYLENNLASHAFTRTHTRILQLLTTQAISSLEISRYYAQVQSLNRSLEDEIDERKRTESKLEFLANHDALTNLPNRRLFYDRVQHSILRTQRTGGRVAVLFLDLDQFKTINDSLSHQVGDRLLQQVAERLAAEIRDGDTLGRLGGDEYVLLMEGGIDLRDLSTVASKLLGTFKEPFHVDGHDLYPTGSLGISLYPDDASDADQLLRNADAAMYQAKQLGRNNYQFFSAKLAETAAERLTLERDLRHAIERGEFELHIQPQVSLNSGRITGGEALLRWNHPQRGLMMPGSFIPVAEESGNIIAIGEWVLRQACNQLQAWRQAGIEIGSLAINVSGSQFSRHGGFATLVKRILGDSDIDPSSLEIELTESVIMQDTEETMRSLDDLNRLGVRLAIDDFGTGYSSLSYLHRLPVHRLKIDRSFVSNLPHAQDGAMIVQSIMLLGSNLGKQVIAEGIETLEQRQFLHDAGCPEGQGYLFGPPMPPAAFSKLLQHEKSLLNSC
ncbi:MAG: EAL domain-containing protein [Candidatus Thiodiazotropha sp. (ex Epidulcina cf. delphinae)]|nr:EAL domain-containing protein [Candidatus Thiodiazotropha sp. (ex Epidulcina cf. delphinae)]